MLVQTDLFSEDSFDPLTTLTAVQRHFKDVKSFNDLDVMKFSGGYEPFRGSMVLASKMKQTFPFTNALNWMPALKKYILNKEYQFLDFETIIRAANRDGLGDGAFIRPVSGLKEFSGQVFTSVGKLENEFIFATKNRNISPYLICVAAPAQAIFEEYRCVFIDGKYIDGAQYLYSGQRTDRKIPNDCYIADFARKIAEEAYFANVGNFIIDLAETSSGLYLLEINAFETASFYSCGLDKIYKAWANSLNENF